MTAHLSYLRKSHYLLGSLVLLSTFADLPLLDAEERPCPASQQSSGLDRYFEREVWPKVVEAECLKCHNMVGDAKDTRLVFRDLLQASPKESQDWLRCNGELLKQAADWESDEGSMLLAKVTGGLSHGGEVVLKPDSTAYRILEQFVRRVKDPTSQPLTDTVETDPQRPFFEGVEMLDDRRLLRRAVLSLAGRLPTEAEVAAVKDQGLGAMHSILDGVMQEEAFYERIREAFNDIFLTEGIDGNADSTVLSYEHFEKSRLWYQKHDLSHIEDAKERQQAGYKLANEYRAALLGEPMKLIEHIIRHDRPFTEIVTADYIMVSPYSARGYGIYDEVKERFADPDDPFEYIPVKLKALVGRNKSENQESASGFYPHAGILSTFQYLSRYPTTETNRNRLRARMFYQHFLGVDVLELAARGSDAAAVTAKFEVPTMQAAECVVCHKTLDPVAGLFQDYWRFDANFAIYGRRKDGWFTDMFGAGFEGEGLPSDERWRALAWLGEKTAKDPRFAIAMSEHAYYVLTGRRLLQPPKDIDDPMFASRRRAYQVQRKVVQAIAAKFIDSGFSFKQLIKDWVVSDFYRADGVKASEISPERLTELEDVGVVRLLSPEQVERKIKAVFGKHWGRLNEQTAMLYGGIDSKEVTERATDPSGAMGAIQRTLANDVACRNVALDFSRSASERVLFPTIEPDVTPGISEDLDRRIRLAIVHLHERILGQYDQIDSPEVDRTFALFSGIMEDAKKQSSVEPQEIWSCRQGLEKPVPDPHYTVRAWRAVVTYLLRRREFLYE
ncbi:MAG: hypothetical protein MUD03_10325 [Pirellula sp.]|nr:hypothetical protein [Pirellula sp.]